METSERTFARYGRHFSAGETLFREGETGDVMYVLHSGVVRISMGVAGEEKTLALLGPGEFVGEMAILNSKPRTATATAVEPVEALVLNAKQLEEMITNNAEIALRLMKKLAMRIESANSLVEILSHRDPRARVMLGLLRHANGFGVQTEDGTRLRIDFEELAREVGVEEPAVAEVMNRLERLRLAFVNDEGELVVVDATRLREFLEFLKTAQKFERV